MESRRHIASRPALLAAGAGGLAVAATASALTVGGGAPAYALTANRDGTVTLALYQASGIAQANAKLHQLGDKVVLVPVRPGCPALGSLLRQPGVMPSDKTKISVQTTKDGSITVNANAVAIPAGDILVVAAEVSANGTRMAAALTSPPAPSCVSLPATPGESGPRVVHNGGSGQKAIRRGGPGEHVVHGGGSGTN